MEATLVLDPHVNVPILSVDEALGGVILPGETRIFLDNHLDSMSARADEVVRLHNLSPARGVEGLLTGECIANYLELRSKEHRGDLQHANLLEVLSYLRAVPEKVVCGLEVIILSLWNGRDPREVILTCTEPGQLRCEAYPSTRRFEDKTWNAHERLRFIFAADSVVA